MNKVYITQVPTVRDHESKTLVPRMDLSAATEHGELVVLMPSRAPFADTQPLIEQLEEKLKGFCDGDSILPLGDPVVIACTFALMGMLGQDFGVLKWIRSESRYRRIPVNL